MKCWAGWDCLWDLFQVRMFSFKCSPFECQATAQLNVCIKCTYNLERQKKNFVQSVWRKWNILPYLFMKPTGLCRVGRDKRKWRLLWIVRGVSACSGCPSPEQQSQKPQVSWGPCWLCAGCTAFQSLILLVVFLKIVFLNTGGLTTGRPHHQYKRMFVVFNGMIKKKYISHLRIFAWYTFNLMRVFGSEAVLASSTDGLLVIGVHVSRSFLI